MSWDFRDAALRQHLTSAEYGIEKESLRVTPDGRLSHTPHPFADSRIDRDFCENQTEIITGVHHDVGSLFTELREIHGIANQQLSRMNELLWPFSNPPIVLSPEDIPIARFEGELKERETYRQYLADKYGKAKMLYSGIHFNFSFSHEMLLAVFRRSGEDDFRRFKDNVYARLGSRLIRYTWLIVYLTAASPLIDKSFLRLSALSETERYRYASFRCSEVGYWNDFLPILDFTDVQSYTDSIKRYIDDGRLYAASELYYPLRLKPKGKNSLSALNENGVNHIELRCLDVNPLSPDGLFTEDVRFLHLLMLYLMSLEDAPLDERAQRAAIENIKTASLFNDTEHRIKWEGRSVPLREAAVDTLDQLEDFAKQYAPAFCPAVAYQKEKPGGKRYAEQIRESFTHYIQDGLRLAEKYRGSSCACCLG